MSTSRETDHEFESLLEYLRQSRGFDFTGYKRASLMRRIRRRMQTVQLDAFDAYKDHLEVHPDEFAHLFDTILINVTAFQRDAPTWEFLASHVVPEILAAKRPGEPIRLWSAGCASGEEAYSLAILFAQHIGVEAFRDRVKIYATDLDEEALNHARQAVYTTRAVSGLSDEVRDLYFDAQDSHFTFRKDLRRNVVFGRHDLIQDAPISRVDLLTCRNTLMYLNAETQARILSRFHFALNDEGFLTLGKAEMLFSHSHIFTPVNLKHRVFTKVSRSGSRARPELPPAENGDVTRERAPDDERLRMAALEYMPVAQIIVDNGGNVVTANGRARQLFGVKMSDVGRPLKDLEISYRPADLRSRIDEVRIERRPILLKNIEVGAPAQDVRWLDVSVVPLTEDGGELQGVSITFHDVSLSKRLQEQLEHANEELETTNEELESTIEELETTNEELQSTNEELETTNEELQSTNEELETMNEELQSTNEELETINEELRRRSEEMRYANAFTSAILTSLRGAVVALDTNLHITVWNEKADDLWGVRAEEAIGQPLMNLDIGLPVKKLKTPVLAMLRDEAPFAEMVLPSTNRRGRPIECKVTATPFKGKHEEPLGVILLMEDADGESQ